MKKIKKLWVISLIVLTGFGLKTVNISASSEKVKGQAQQVLIAANDKADLQPADEKNASTDKTATAEPAKEESKAVFIVGALVMGLLMVIVLYKTKGIEK